MGARSSGCALLLMKLANIKFSVLGALFGRAEGQMLSLIDHFKCLNSITNSSMSYHPHTAGDKKQLLRVVKLGRRLFPGMQGVLGWEHVSLPDLNTSC